jgi:hypothetical protein
MVIIFYHLIKREEDYESKYLSEEISDCFVVGYLLGMVVDRLLDNC